MRKKATRKIIVLLFLAVAVVYTIAACDNAKLRFNQGDINPTVLQTPLGSAQKPMETKIVNHTLGQAEIPLHPQRIVVLDGNNYFLLDALLALGMKPVGLARCSGCINLDPFSEFLSDLPSVGTDEQPSLEKILSLKPDLILGYEWQKVAYPQLAKIAPTMMIDIYSGGNDFKRNTKHLAEILGKSDQVEGILAEYNEQVQKFRQRFGEKLKTKTVSLLAFWGSTVHVYGPELIAYAQVMSDIGIQFIPKYRNLKDNYLQLSLETISDWDADFLFIEPHLKTDLENDLISFLEEPVWSTMKAVRNDQVYIMTEYPSGGPIGAKGFIDELSKYFSSKL